MIRPVDTPVGQGYGANPTSVLPATHWVIKQFGNYQPDGHAGEDYPCNIGTPIRAVTSGRVVHVGYYGGTYADNPYWIAPNFAGYCYVIDHGAFIGIYAHGQDGATRVRAGQQVSEGQVIGLSGNTGGSTGPHLHFEVLPDGFVVNSYMYGRIDPATIFAGGGLAAQGTITPTEEDDMFTDKDRARLETTQGKVETLIGMLDNVAGAVKGTPSAILDKQIPRANSSATTSLALFLSYADADRNATVARIQSAIASIPAPDLAAQIDAAGLAADVRDELVKLIGGK